MGLALKKTPIDIKDLFQGWENDLRDKKPGVEVIFSDDPIALSWASYHVWQKWPARRWTDLNEVQAHEHDRNIAAETRRYYRDKLMLQTLKGRPLSAYQAVLYGMVTGEVPITNDQMGVLLKLPYFYTEDTYLADVFGRTRCLGQQQHQFESKQDTITPIHMILSSKKRAETCQYWFSNSAGHAVMLPVTAQNSLRGLIDGLFRQQQTLTVQAHWHCSSHLPTGRMYWALRNMELVA